MAKSKDEPRPVEETPKQAEPPKPESWRFVFRGTGLPAITIDGVIGGESEARAELHKHIDSLIVSCAKQVRRERKPIPKIPMPAWKVVDAEHPVDAPPGPVKKYPKFEQIPVGSE